MGVLAELTESVIRMLEIDEMNVVAAVSVDVRQRRAETGPVVGARVEHVEPGVLQLDQRAHHERQRVKGRPRADVLRPVVNVHLRRVDLQRHLANAVDESRRHEVVQRWPFGKLDVHFDKVQRSLQSHNETFQPVKDGTEMVQVTVEDSSVFSPI